MYVKSAIRVHESTLYTQQGMKVQSSHYFLGPLVRDSSLSLSFAVHGTKGADLPLFIAAMVRQTSCERGGPTLGVDGEFKQSHFLPGSHREDSLGLVSADSVTRPTSRTVLSLSPSSHRTRDHDSIGWPLNEHENRTSRLSNSSRREGS